MQTHRTSIQPSTYQNIPVIDGEFDRFELNSDLSFNLHEAEGATFYHNASDLEE